MVEFWMMIVVASSSGTMMGATPAPPVYYTQELCLSAAKEIQAKSGAQHMCVPVRPMVDMQMNGNVVYGNVR